VYSEKYLESDTVCSLPALNSSSPTVLRHVSLRFNTRSSWNEIQMTRERHENTQEMISAGERESVKTSETSSHVIEASTVRWKAIWTFFPQRATGRIAFPSSRYLGFLHFNGELKAWKKILVAIERERPVIFCLEFNSLIALAIASD